MTRPARLAVRWPLAAQALVLETGPRVDSPRLRPSTLRNSIAAWAIAARPVFGRVVLLLFPWTCCSVGGGLVRELGLASAFALPALCGDVPCHGAAPR